jgi:orotidine-5'-phosphate decarboxylase
VKVKGEASGLQHPSEALIVALDAASMAEALRLARRLRGLVRAVKVGGILFTACGPDILRRLRELGFAVMLDLKFFDIPSTVEGSCRAAAGHGVSLLTVHAAGEPAMLEAAVRGARASVRRGARPRVLAVTVLTSAGAAQASAVRALAMRAVRAGCDGVVASAREARLLRRSLGRTPLIVCPGIRPAGAEGLGSSPAGRWNDDQRRVCTPGQALAAGASALVVGRPITAAPDPARAAARILEEMREAVRC